MSRHERITPDAAADEPEAADNPVDEAPPKRSRKVLIGGLAAALLLAVAGWFGYGYWTTGRFLEKTDDAYVTADVTLVSSRVQGYVASVEVASNAHVSAGDVLVRLDDGDYRNALETAQSRVASAGETLARIDAQINAAQAGVRQAEASRDVAEAQRRTADTDFERVTQLAADNVASRAQLDTATETQDVARAGVASAEAAVASAEAQVAVLRAQRAEAEGQRDELRLAAAQAQRNLDLTVLRAASDGIVANMTLEPGDLVAPGARLAALIPDGSLYIEANLKETQLAGVGPGASVEISLDALPGQTFEGEVASISPATGAVFSLLPADNATGNFTKIVQRVPVRIALPADAIATGQLRAGLSAEIAIDIRTTPGPDATRVAAE